MSPRGLGFGNYPQLYKPKQTTHNHHYQEALFSHKIMILCTKAMWSTSVEVYCLLCSSLFTCTLNSFSL